jgi:hypothetical protein
MMSALLKSIFIYLYMYIRMYIGRLSIREAMYLNTILLVGIRSVLSQAYRTSKPTSAR